MRYWTRSSKARHKHAHATRLNTGARRSLPGRPGKRANHRMKLRRYPRHSTRSPGSMNRQLSVLKSVTNDIFEPKVWEIVIAKERFLLQVPRATSFSEKLHRVRLGVFHRESEISRLKKTFSTFVLPNTRLGMYDTHRPFCVPGSRALVYTPAIIPGQYVCSTIVDNIPHSHEREYQPNDSHGTERTSEY